MATAGAEMNEIDVIDETVYDSVQILLSRLAREHCRFDFLVVGVGSTKDDLLDKEKSPPNEYDFCAVVRAFCTNSKKAFRIRESDDYEGYYEVRCSGQAADDYYAWITTNEDGRDIFNPSAMKDDFLKTVRKTRETMMKRKGHCLQAGMLFGSEEPVSGISGPAVTLGFVWNGEVWKDLAISVDLTICIPFRKAPDCLDILDSERIHKQSILHKVLPHLMQTYGCCLVCSTSLSSLWKVSTSFLEVGIFQSLPYDHVVKRAIRYIKEEKNAKLINSRPEGLMKYVAHSDDCKFMLSSYLIKTAGMEMLGRLPRELLESLSFEEVCVCLVHKLYSYIRKFKISHYLVEDLEISALPLQERLLKPTFPTDFIKVFSDIVQQCGLQEPIDERLAKRMKMKVIRPHDYLHEHGITWEGIRNDYPAPRQVLDVASLWGIVRATMHH